MKKQLERIRKAYDECIERYNGGIDSFVSVPQEFKESPEFSALIEGGRHCNMGNPDIRKFLNPHPGMKFLDAGCGAGLVSYKLYEWPSTYHGIDISPATIELMQAFLERQNIKTCGLKVADLSSLPFSDDFFDIGACIGVLEYHGLPYVNLAVAELHRVCKSGSRFVLDIPNQNHEHYSTMIQLEEYLSRPHVPFTRGEFEKKLASYFKIADIDDTKIMIKYYLNA
ncbi:methyltransferase domain-containing protein [candidate division WOR-3 bacterium]|uniref:Methyltransferase domain-containing protein n=1 Tax=candidate division WOR-3 bacterium TaxID=2052148 RepID=A0A9D5QCJ4_UNCW3|nr:methyltransferase domain-containing protein [candidate division WOR-3 bacterium]MBD3364619.1 methyltransferase domain-containing protein [candidate division WOR-3 bacterium]